MHTPTIAQHAASPAEATNAFATPKLDASGLIKAQIKNTLKKLIKKHRHQPEGLLDEIEALNTPVILLEGLQGQGLSALLSLVLPIASLQYGFIAPSPDNTIFSILCNQFLPKAKQQAALQNGLFLLNKKQISLSYMIHQLYHWQAFKNGLTGYQPDALQAYQKFWNGHQGKIDAQVLQWTPETLTNLRQAINREMEALNLLSEFAESQFC